MSINWKVRIKNKNFWLALIPALILGLLLRRFLDGYNRKTLQAIDSTKVML